jgi:hypothetical protein
MCDYLHLSRFVAKCVLFGIAAAISIGCGSSGMVPIEGQVAYQGQPLANATLTFYPAKGRPLLVSVLDGEYDTELPPGDYTIAVTRAIDMPQGYGRTHWNQVPPQAVTLPDEYASRTKTPLTATVAADQAEPINFELK